MPTYERANGGTRLVVAAALALGAVVACSSADPPAMKDIAALTSVTGTVGPATFNAASVIVRQGVLATPTPNRTTSTVRGLRILLSDKAASCSANHSATAVLLAVTIRGGAVGASTYTVKAPSSRVFEEGEANADFVVTDSACRTTFNQASAGGTVTIATTTPRVTGYLDVVFPSGRVRGAFDAERCPALEAHDEAGANDCVP